jgi:beta-lactamase class A
MMRLNLPCVALLLMSLGAVPASRPATSQPTDTAAGRAGEVAKRFSADPAAGGFDGLFAPSFLAAVPPEKLAGLFRTLYGQAGRCVGVEAEGSPSPVHGRFRLTFEKGLSAVATVSVEPAEPHRIDGLWIGPFEPIAADFPSLIGQLRALPGTASLCAVRLDGAAGPSVVAALQPDRPLAIGSAFKLYVLAELVRQVNAGHRQWDDVVRLDPARRSLPSGVLQAWPAGSPLTVQSLATLMISQSDNTAADELLATLGRENVEAELAAAGHPQPQLDVPFLTTGELFRLKSSPALADAYARADLPGRRALLAGPVAAVAMDAVHPWTTPRHVADVEWLASAADLCRAMRYLRDQTAAGSPAAPARAVLAVNPGLAVDPAAWPYVGFKGGSEPGVMDLTFLLRSARGHWFALSLTWNDPAAAVDEARLIGLATAAMRLLAKSDV